MKLIIHSVLYCCLLATVAHCAELEDKSKLRKRLSIWPGSRFRRNVDTVSAETSANLESLVRQEDTRDIMLPQSSSKTNIRSKRSKNTVNQTRWQGCSLGTCTVHDLAHRLHQLSNTNSKLKNAPANKMSPQGYGRRRRRSLPAHRVMLKLEEGRLRAVWRKTDSQVHKLEALLRQT
ncbi:pro-adrenomedullin-like isoform 1-T1 [Synchiropus picturatus]